MNLEMSTEKYWNPSFALWDDGYVSLAVPKCSCVTLGTLQCAAQASHGQERTGFSPCYDVSDIHYIYSKCSLDGLYST